MAVNRKNIRLTLSLAMERTRAELGSTADNLSSITADVVSGATSAHAKLQAELDRAAEDYRSAVNAYVTALLEFNSFVSHGTIPARLKQPVKKRGKL